MVHLVFFPTLEVEIRLFVSTNCILNVLSIPLNPVADHNNEKRLEVLFSELFRQHEHNLYTLAFRLTKSDCIAKDIIQEVFLKLWEHRNSIPTIVNMEAWLYRLTENKVIDFLRKTAADTRLRKVIWDHMQNRMSDAESYVAEREYNQIIQKAIDELPPQRKLIYQLNKENDMDYQQIAEELHISKHTVKNQLFTAVQSVRRFFTRNIKLFSFFF
jgi:RNA polymerase sigma-70 factor (ECF subfamily)